MEEIQVLLVSLIDEIKNSGNNPSDRTLEVLSKYQNTFNFVEEYLQEYFPVIVFEETE